MTHYLVKHSTDDFRLHAPDGTGVVTANWSHRPDKNEMASAIAADGPGGSLLGEDDLRDAFVDVVSGGVSFRDTTLNDETVPWGTQ